MSLEQLRKDFEELDRDFTNISTVNDEVFVYNATDVLVQTTWELPIVIQCPESTVNFEFCSNPGDISFGIVFVAAPEEDQDESELEIETVEEMSIMRSHYEPISGSFEVPYEGVVFFMWDNNFDWSANKQISYIIEVKQPSLAVADKARVESVQPLLADTVDELKVSYARRADAQDLIEHTSANISFMEDQLMKLKERLDAKKKESSEMEALQGDMLRTIQLGSALKAGLCMRMLDRSLLSLVCSYLDLEGGINYVCKYWADIVASIRMNGQLPSSSTLPSRPILKRAKSEVRRELQQIYTSVKLQEARLREEAKSESREIRNSTSVLNSNRSKRASTSITSATSSVTTTSAARNAATAPIKTAATGLSDSGNESDDLPIDLNVISLDAGLNTIRSADTTAAVSTSAKMTGKGSTALSATLAQHSGSLKGSSLGDRLAAAQQPQSKSTAVDTMQSHGPSLTMDPTNDSTVTNLSTEKVHPSLAADTKRKGLFSKGAATGEASSTVVKESGVHRKTRTAGVHRERHADNDRSLLLHVKKVRSEQQLSAMIDYLQAGFVKIENLNNEKRRIKKLIRAWNSSFEKKHSRFPTSSERKGHLRELYEEYQQVSLALRIRTERMDEALKSVGLTKETFEQLRDKKEQKW